MGALGSRGSICKPSTWTACGANWGLGSPRLNLQAVHLDGLRCQCRPSAPEVQFASRPSGRLAVPMGALSSQSSICKPSIWTACGVNGCLWVGLAKPMGALGSAVPRRGQARQAQLSPTRECEVSAQESPGEPRGTQRRMCGTPRGQSEQEDEHEQQEE